MLDQTRQAAATTTPRSTTLASVRITHGLANRLVMAGDIAAIILAGQLFRIDWLGRAPALSASQALVASAFAATAFVLVQHAIDAYRVERYRRPLMMVLEAAFGFAVAAVISALALYAFRTPPMTSGLWWLVWASAVFSAILNVRLVAGALFEEVRRRRLLSRRVVVIGEIASSRDLAARIGEAHEALDNEVLGAFSFKLHDTQSMNAAAASVRRLGEQGLIDLIVINLPWSRAETIFDLAERLQWISADIAVPFRHDGFRPDGAVVTYVAGMRMLRLAEHPFKGTQGLVKLALDYAVAVAALIVVLPVIAVAAAAVKLTSPGPAFFRQPRMGLNGKIFEVWKLRTMQVDPRDDGSAGTTRDDPRVTPLGALLRRTSIDELPQIFNVLRGEMSIVGPRPHVPAMLVGDEVYSEAVGFYAARHRIKPGITGWAQINGMRGGINDRERAQTSAELDLYYIRNWSFALDIKIMARTAFSLFGRDVF